MWAVMLTSVAIYAGVCWVYVWLEGRYLLRRRGHAVLLEDWARLPKVRKRFLLTCGHQRHKAFKRAERCGGLVRIYEGTVCMDCGLKLKETRTV